MKSVDLPTPDKQRRLELNRAAAIRSRKKKKQEEDQLRLHVEFLQESNQHLDLKLQEYSRILTDQTHYTTLLKANLYQLVMENSSLRARLKEKGKDTDKGASYLVE